MCIFQIEVDLGTLCCQVMLYAYNAPKLFYVCIYFFWPSYIMKLPVPPDWIPLPPCDFCLYAVSNVIDLFHLRFTSQPRSPLPFSSLPLLPFGSKALLLCEITGFSFSFSYFPSHLVPWHFTPEVHEPGMWHDFWFTVCSCNMSVRVLNKSPGLVEENKARETNINHNDHLQPSSPLISMLTTTLTLQHL